jgi:hypothetical protein
LAHAIFYTYGARSDMWKTFTQVLAPVAIPSVLWQQYDDGNITYEQFSALMPGGWDDSSWVEWPLNEVIMAAFRSTIWDASRKCVSQSRKAAKIKKVDVKGLTIHIDRPEGFVQKGTDAEGKPWTRVYQTDYGFIPGTQGGDGEAMDVFVGKFESFTSAYLIEQLKKDGTFDEWKLMLQFCSMEEAIGCYLAHIPAEFKGQCYEIPFEAVKGLLAKEPAEVHKSLDLQKSLKSVRWKVKTVDGTAQTKEQYILGIVLVPDEVDLQGEFYTAETIRKAAHWYMEYYRQIGDEHRSIMVYGNNTPDQEGVPASLVESYLAPVAFEMNGEKVPVGTWLVGMKFYDPVYWARIESGEITGLSMGGLVAVKQ